MISILRIKNFQNHRDNTLEFHPGVNVITGSSDNGKSVIVRALNWLFFNRPAGFGFRRNGAPKNESTLVAGVFGHYEVCRERDIHGVNQYVLDDQIFQALRTDVPQEIQEAINMNPFMFQGQFDNHFLLQQSPGEVARLLNEVVGVDDITEYLRIISRLKTECDSDIKKTEADIKEVEEGLKQFDVLPEIEVLITEIEGLTEQRDIIAEGIKNLGKLIASAQKLEQEIGALSSLIPSEEELKEAQRIAGLWIQVDSEVYRIQGHVDRIESISVGILDLTNRVRCTNELDELANLADKVKTVGADVSKLTRAIMLAQSLESTVSTIDRDQRATQEKLSTLLQTVKICPLCNHPFEE